MPRPISPIYNAASNGHIEAVRLLIEHGVDLNSIQAKLAIIYAAVHDHIEVIRLLLDSGMSPDCVIYGRERVGYKRSSLLHAAIRSGCIDMVRLLIARGVNLGEREGWKYPLEYAIEYSTYDICELLLDSGADPNIGYNDSPRKTLLYRAVSKERADICKLLISKGAIIYEGLVCNCEDSEEDSYNEYSDNKGLNKIIKRSCFLMNVWASMQK
jgi:ankyrin repeat protein